MQCTSSTIRCNLHQQPNQFLDIISKIFTLLFPGNVQQQFRVNHINYYYYCLFLELQRKFILCRAKNKAYPIASIFNERMNLHTCAFHFVHSSTISMLVSSSFLPTLLFYHILLVESFTLCDACIAIEMMHLVCFRSRI